MRDLSSVDLVETLDRLRETEPLIQYLTNEVTKNDLAQITLHWGGLPVMSDAPEESVEMADLASGMLLNTGRMSDMNVEALHNAGQRASERSIPVVLDPVGAGATPTRMSVAQSLLDSVDVSIIKGNYGEISALAGSEAEVKGVESVGEYESIEATAQALADATGAVVVASGVTDVVADADQSYAITGGHEMMGEIVGTGCMLGATLATVHGATEDTLHSALAGTIAFNIAGERAADLPHNGPASYRINFLDSVFGMRDASASDLSVADRIE
ncbi:hydroxyethylthiazole kinase [Halovenus marina]|uniref:hydroxyethylthiazole kinase n=1 Tax=Halovenus marina TaxID=3396621 RepID=UPI003F56DFEF